MELYEDQDPIDTVTLQERLKVWELLEQVGGVGYISTLPEAVPSVANLSFYIAGVREKYLMRRMVTTCIEAVSSIYEANGDSDEVMDGIERDILRVSELRVSESTADIKTLVQQATDDIEAMQKRQGQVLGIPSGFSDLDKMTGGFKGGEMIVIAGRPGTGKTSLAMNIAEYVSVDCGLPVGVFSLEMTARSLTRRMLCARARVNLRNVRDGFLADRDLPKLALSAGKIARAPIYLDDSSGLSVLQVRAKARRMWQRYGVKLFVVDYLQLMNAIGGRRKIDNRQQEVADISAGMKSLAKELNVPVIVLSQLNRDIEKEKNRKPRLADLRESGAVEQDADVVGMLYRPRADDDADDNDYGDAVPVNLYIPKQRNGPTGEVNLTFLKAYTRFESAARVSDEDVPYDGQQPPLPGQ